MNVSRRVILAISLVGAIHATTFAQTSASELNIAAAADLSAALKDIADTFQRNTGTQVRLSFGASGALTQQIENGAPFDLFFSADMDYPRQLIKDNQADSGG